MRKIIPISGLGLDKVVCTSAAALLLITVSLFPMGSILITAPAAHAQTNHKYVILTFDDSQEGQYLNAKPILDKYGFKATFFVICGAVGNQLPNWPGEMSWSEVTDLQKDGMDIESHTMTHQHLDTLSQSQLDNEVGGSKQCFANHGINSTIFGYPYSEGDNNDTVVNEVANYYNLARTTRENLWFLHCDKYSSHPQTDCRTYLPDGTLQYANRYDIRARSIDPYYNTYNYNYTAVFNVFVNWVNSQNSYNQNGAVTAIPIVNFHQVLPVTGQNYTTPTSFFDQLMGYLHDNGFVTLTMNDLSYDTTNNAMYINTLTSSGQHRTSLTLNPISAVPWGQTVTVSGKLTDSDAGGVGLGGKVISFSGVGANNTLSPVTTNPDGTFSASGIAPNTVSTKWQVTAQFAGDAQDEGSLSTLRTYSTFPHAVTLVVSASCISTACVSNSYWNTLMSFTSTLTDSTLTSHPLIQGKSIQFNGTGVLTIPATNTTTAAGTATIKGTSPSTVFTGWTYQAHFAGDSLYNARDSAVKSYNTIPHKTGLGLGIFPSSLSTGAAYKVSGTLKDTITGTVLGGMTISFTATSPITISSTTTASTGVYTVSGLKAPTTAGSYNIQASFSGNSLYSAANSPTATLTVTSP